MARPSAIIVGCFVGLTDVLLPANGLGLAVGKTLGDGVELAVGDSVR